MYGFHGQKRGVSNAGNTDPEAGLRAQPRNALSKRTRVRVLPILWAAVAIVALLLFLGSGRRSRCRPVWFRIPCSAIGGGGCEDAQDPADARGGLGDRLSKEEYLAARSEITSSIMHAAMPDQESPEDIKLNTSRVGMSQTGDSSIRCRVSDICDGQREQCYPGADGLGCIHDIGQRRDYVIDAIKWAWTSYQRCAWGYDELQPISCRGRQWFGLGLYMVDALDTLILAGMTEDVEEVVQWIDTLDSAGAPNATSNTFECTIRIVGGLLSAAHLLDGDRRLLKPAVEVALRLLSAFKTRSGIPYSDVNLQSITAGHPYWTSFSSLSESTTLSLEFSHVARVASYDAIAAPALHVWEVMKNIRGTAHGLAPMFLDPNSGSSGSFGSNHVTLGARGDSYYEYIVESINAQYGRKEAPIVYMPHMIDMAQLPCPVHQAPQLLDSALGNGWESHMYMLKQYIIGGQKDKQLLHMYQAAMQGVRTILLGQTGQIHNGGLLYIGEWTMNSNNKLSGKMDHLVCFLPGVLALGHFYGIETGTHPHHLNDLELAEQLMHTCYMMYKLTPTGLAPELVHFVDEHQSESRRTREHQSTSFNAEDGIGGSHFLVKQSDSHNLLRPETVESIFVLWRVTGNAKYRNWGWQIFRALEMHARLKDGGYTSLDSVLSVPASRRDNTESFFIAETLKYLLLLFSPAEILPLVDYVFNTEAHPLPIMHSAVEKNHSAWYMKPPKGLGQTISLDSSELRSLISQFQDSWKSD